MEGYYYFFLYFQAPYNSECESARLGPTLESKDMRAIFQKKDKKIKKVKKIKIFENLGKNV